MKKFVFCGAFSILQENILHKKSYYHDGEREMSDRNKQMIIVKKRKESKIQCEKLELLYVIQGTMKLQTDKKEIRMQSRDILVIHPGEWYEWSGMNEEDVLLCKIMMDPYQMKKVCAGKEIQIVCNSVENPKKDYGRIHYIIDSMVKKYVGNENEFVVKSLYYTLWETLKNGFAEEVSSEKKQSERIKGILEYIQEEYASPLSLKTLSETYYMSDSALSREFKRETGENFTEYLRTVRLEKVREQLLYTDKNITQIAIECGFADVSVLNKNFKKEYGMAPGIYRRQKYEEEITDCVREETETIQTYLEEHVYDKKEDVILHESKERQLLSLNVDQTEIMENPHLKCINVGMAVDLLEAKVQKQVRFVVERLKFPYIRISNIFAKELKIRPAHECENLNFDKLDEIFDFLSEIGVYPFIELPEKQQKYMRDIGTREKIGTEEKSEIIESTEEWEMLLQQFLRHMIERYTLGTVDQWIFEISEDIDQETGAAKHIPYEKLYEISASCIRNYLPNAKIGGCGRNCELEEEILRQRLLFWKTSGYRPDFLSFMSYPYGMKLQKNHGEYRILDMQSDKSFVKADLQEYRRLLKQVEYPETPIWITEWNTSLSERNIYNDSCAKAGHMLKQMTEMLGEVEGMCYWSVSDCHARYFDTKQPFVGATGVLSKDGLCKPSYYAYEFWSFIGQKVIGKGENYIVSSRGSHEYNILLFYPQKFDEVYHTYTENEIGVKELSYIFEKQESREYSFLLKNIEDGMKKISTYHISEKEGNLLSEWKKIGYLDSLNPVEIEYLKNRCNPRMEVIRKNVTNHNLKLDIKIEPNEMCLIFIL